MVLTLIRATKKTTLNCIPALSVCLVLSVHCKRPQQLRTICTFVTDYTRICLSVIHIADAKNFSNKMGLLCFFAGEMPLT